MQPSRIRVRNAWPLSEKSALARLVAVLFIRGLIRGRVYTVQLYSPVQAHPREQTESRTSWCLVSPLCFVVCPLLPSSLSVHLVHPSPILQGHNSCFDHVWLTSCCTTSEGCFWSSLNFDEMEEFFLPILLYELPSLSPSVVDCDWSAFSGVHSLRPLPQCFVQFCKAARAVLCPGKKDGLGGRKKLAVGFRKC